MPSCFQPHLWHLCTSLESIQSDFPTHTFSCILTIITTIHIEKMITKSAFTVSSNTYYTALMLVGRRTKKIPSESLLFSYCSRAVELHGLHWKFVWLRRGWTHSKEILMLNRSNTAIPSLTPEIPQFFPNLLLLVVWGSIITKLLLSYFPINHCRKQWWDIHISDLTQHRCCCEISNFSKLFYK